MKGLSLTQPWATLVAVGAKRIETRSWRSPYRGLVAIHAAKGFPPTARMTCDEEPFYSVLRPHYDWTLPGALPRGAIVATARLVDIRPTERWIAVPDFYFTNEHAFGDYSLGRFGWVLEDVRRVMQPIPCRGALGLWDVPADIKPRLGLP